MIKKIILITSLALTLNLYAFGAENPAVPSEAPAPESRIQTENTTKENTGQENKNTTGRNSGDMPQDRQDFAIPKDNPASQESKEATVVEAAEVEVSFWEEYFTPIVSVILLGLGFVFVIFYKRKNF